MQLFQDKALSRSLKVFLQSGIESIGISVFHGENESDNVIVLLGHKCLEKRRIGELIEILFQMSGLGYGCIIE